MPRDSDRSTNSSYRGTNWYLQMAPVKFGLFKARSRDHQDQPSTENLLQSSSSSELAQTPGSPIPSTSKGYAEDMETTNLSLNLDSDDENNISENKPTVRRVSECSRLEEVSQMNYTPLKSQTSTDARSISALQDKDFDQTNNYDFEDDTTLEIDEDGASTSCDANSLQFDQTSIAPSEDLSVYCGAMKKPKKSRSKEEKQLRDFDMWRASNVEVMQNLLNRSGTVDEQIKWEAIATARGLCTLTDSCSCGDCKRAKYLAGIADGDGGLGAAPLFNAISVGCSVQ